MIKKTHKYILGFLSICFLCCNSVCIPVYADTPNKLLDSAIIQSSNGIISVVSQSSRYIWLISVENFDGTVTIDYGDTVSYCRYVLSNDDIPEDIVVGYTFISSNFHNTSGTTVNINVSGYKYLYVSGQRSFSYTLTPNTPLEPTPTFTPTPTPIITGGDSIPLDYDIPFDYYLIAIIILLGGILVCQLFKN